MQVTYELSADDYIAFNLYHQAHSPSIKRRQLFSRWFLPVAMLFFGWTLDQRDGGITGRTTFAMASLIWVLLFPAYWRWCSVRLVRRLLSEGLNSSLGKSNTLSIGPEGLQAVGPEGESKLKWTAVEKIVTSESYVYLYVSAVSALMIPTAAFADSAARNQFVEAARQYREAAAGLIVA